MKTTELPKSIIEQQRRAGKARWRGMSAAERSEAVKHCWRVRVEKARKAAGMLITSARSLPE